MKKDLKIFDEFIGLRVTTELLLKIDLWAKANELDRSEAIRTLLSLALP